MSAAGFELRVGGRVWLDGQGWEVAELVGTTVRLLADGRLRTVSVASLANAFADDPEPSPNPSDDQSWTVPAVVLAALSTKQRDALQRQVTVLRQVLEPPDGDDRTVADRYAAAAADLGISRRTLERQLARLREQGPAGLVDARKLRDLRRTVDPRWDIACREVLDSYTSRSNPTMQTVIDQANRRYLTAAPDGVVPSRSVAYLRLAELDQGQYTFGAAKQRRSVAKRPTGVLGRLLADRPGPVRDDGLLPAGRVRNGAGHQTSSDAWSTPALISFSKTPRPARSTIGILTHGPRPTAPAPASLAMSSAQTGLAWSSCDSSTRQTWSGPRSSSGANSVRLSLSHPVGAAPRSG